MTKKTLSSAGHEDHRQEGSVIRDSAEGGHSTGEITTTDREAIDTEGAILDLSLENRDNSARSGSIPWEAKGKWKQTDSPEGGHQVDCAQSADVDDELKEQNKASKESRSKDGQSGRTTITVKHRVGMRSVRSVGDLQRRRSVEVLRLPRGGEVVTKKREKNTAEGTESTERRINRH